MKAFHAYLLSDRRGAAHAFAGVLLGSTFAGIILLVVGLTALVEVIR